VSRARRTSLFIALCALTFALVTAIASAQSKKKPAKPPRKPAPAAAAPPAAKPDAAAQLAPKAESASPRATTTTREDGGVVEAKTLDGGARVFRFGEMEIEGRLRNPQLVYFLRRVRAEFAAGDLGHRSFMQELSETKKDPNF
jgi:hypothetical protein